MKKFIYFIMTMSLVLLTGVIYSQPPTAGMTSSRTRTCPAFGVNFTDQSVNATSWFWTFEGGSPGVSFAQNPSGITYSTPGQYDVTLVVTNANGSDSITTTDMIRVMECKPSSGIYRIPYEDDTDVIVSQDHFTHSPNPIRIDLRGTGGNGGPYKIVAAADGWIRMIVDNFTGCCNQFGNCSDCNNYVWIEHPNGEWTKYTHFMTGTVTSANFANRSLNEFVCAGDYLGDEGDVGASSGSGRAAVTCDGNNTLQNSIDSLNAVRIGNNLDSIRCGIHLHFEVAIPTDLEDPFDTLGGFINGQNLIPVVCGIPGNIFVKDDTHTAEPCDNTECVDDLLLQNQTFNIPDIEVFQADDEITAQNDFVVNSGASVILSAGNKVVLKPGFRALTGSFLRARTGICNESEGTICNANLRLAITGSEIYDTGSESSGTELITYPNPFSSALTISYTTEESSSVTVEFYNIYGQEIYRMENTAHRKPGTVHKISINTDDLPAGVYFCILRSGGNIKVNKLVKNY